MIPTRNEVSAHSHPCTPVYSDSYATMAVIAETGMADTVRSMVMANATSRNMCDTFSALTGCTLTTQQLSNFKHSSLQQLEALDNLMLLIKRYSSFEGPAACASRTLMV